MKNIGILADRNISQDLRKIFTDKQIKAINYTSDNLYYYIVEDLFEDLNLNQQYNIEAINKLKKVFEISDVNISLSPEK